MGMGSGKGKSRRSQSRLVATEGTQSGSDRLVQPRPRKPLRVWGPEARHGRLEASLGGLADPRLQVKDKEAWHINFSAEQLRWFESVIPAALEGIEKQRAPNRATNRGNAATLVRNQTEAESGAKSPRRQIGRASCRERV